LSQDPQDYESEEEVEQLGIPSKKMNEKKPLKKVKIQESANQIVDDEQVETPLVTESNHFV
jgi:hypothetical protein